MAALVAKGCWAPGPPLRLECRVHRPSELRPAPGVRPVVSCLPPLWGSAFANPCLVAYSPPWSSRTYMGPVAFAQGLIGFLAPLPSLSFSSLSPPAVLLLPLVLKGWVACVLTFLVGTVLRLPGEIRTTFSGRSISSATLVFLLRHT